MGAVGVARAFCEVQMRAMTSHMNRLLTGSIPVDGSSMKMMGGLPIMAMPTESLRLLPPESSPASLFWYCERFMSTRMLSTKLRGVWQRGVRGGGLGF